MGKSPKQAAADLIEMGVRGALVEAGTRARLERARDSRALVSRSRWLTRSLSEAWYTGVLRATASGPRSRIGIAVRAMPATAIDSDRQRRHKKIVGFLAPMGEPIRTRGLVLGHVQSGKTSNFTAVIAKSADAGYRMFVVLSGVHNNLRRQTRCRLDEQLVDATRNKWGAGNWLRLTSATGDFGRIRGCCSIRTTCSPFPTGVSQCRQEKRTATREPRRVARERRLGNPSCACPCL